MKNIGERIKEKREEKGLSGAELARRIGLERESLSRIEHGHTTPRLQTLEKIAEVLNCHVRDLLSEEEYAESSSHMFIANKGERKYTGRIYPGVQRVNVYNEDEAEVVKKLLDVFRVGDVKINTVILTMLDSFLRIKREKRVNTKTKTA